MIEIYFVYAIIKEFEETSLVGQCRVQKYDHYAPRF